MLGRIVDHRGRATPRHDQQAIVGDVYDLPLVTGKQLGLCGQRLSHSPMERGPGVNEGRIEPGAERDRRSFIQVLQERRIARRGRRIRRSFND